MAAYLLWIESGNGAAQEKDRYDDCCFLLAEALTDAAEAFDGDNSDAHISIQLNEDDESEWWRVTIEESYDDDLTHWMNGEDAACDLALIRDGKSEEVGERYAASWGEDWTEYHGDADEAA